MRGGSMATTTLDRPAHRGLGWLGVVLGLGGPAVLVGLTHAGVIDLTLLQRRALGWVVLWGLTLALLAMLAFGEKRSPGVIGLGRFTGMSLVGGLLAGVLAIMAYPLCALLLGLIGVHSQAAATGVAALGALPLWARLLTLATAGVCEEVLYRGYPITRLKELTGSHVAAVIIPFVVFVALHAPSWGLAHLLYVSVVAAIMTALFLWRRDLWSNIIAHLVTDAVPLLLLPLMAHR
jgi:membrane protease YdiL (CAAX protease family)